MSPPAVSLTPEQLYLQLGSLVAEMPDLASGPITPEMNSWLGRAAALVEATGDTFGKVALTNAAHFLAIASTRDYNAQKIAAVVYEALAKAKLAAPAAVQGGFFAAGHTFDAYARVIEVLGAATTDLLMVDPYADAKILQFALSAPEQVSVRILADQEQRHWRSLPPAVERWVQQYPSTRPLSVRLAAPRTLHDRLILVDRATAWMVGQSFKELARKDMHLVRQQDAEATAPAVAAFETMWDAATPLHEWDGPAPV
jgi:hypothetical protein